MARRSLLQAGCESVMEALKTYNREWWENPENPDPRRVVFDALNRYVWSRIPPGEGKKALDIGCGRGTITGMLVRKGYDVTAIDIDETFCHEVSRKFPTVKVKQEDIMKMRFEEVYDLVTCIEVVQYLRPLSLWRLIRILSRHTRTLFINITNGQSLHTRWIKWRGWLNPFCHIYEPKDLIIPLLMNNFMITHGKGIGLLTPISLFRSFKGILIPGSVAYAVNEALDDRWPISCHLFYVEAERRRK